MRIQDAQNNIMAIQTEFAGLKDAVEQNDVEVGTDIDTAMRELDEISSILSSIAGMHTVELDVTQVGSLPNVPVATSDKFHTGGILKAHDGMMLGTYQGRREVPFIGLENEMVVRPEVSEMYTPSQWQRFNSSGNPAALGQAGQRPSKPIIEVNEATPRTWVRIYDEHLYPAHNNMKKRMVRRRHFER
jgi:hypothetical protein